MNRTVWLDDEYKPYRRMQPEQVFRGDLYHPSLSRHGLHHHETGTREH